MHTLKRNALVPYSNRQMFELVNAIEEYPRFLPWCENSHIMTKSDNEVVASLDIAWKGVRKSFTTRNYLTPYKRIDMTLINGPLKHMEGIWMFQFLEEQASKVELDLEFEFTGSIIDIVFQPVFQHIANSLVDAFCKRAVELYGSAE